jgi:photosystem II stability/assembly factor-like uncharacterized protein
VLALPVAVWQGGRGTTRRVSPFLADISNPGHGSPIESLNLTALTVLGGQSLVQVVPLGRSTLWVSTANEVALTGGGQGIELTTNAGKTWSDVTPSGLSVDGGTHWMGDFFALSPTRAWIVFGAITKGPQTIETTGDAGHHWSKVGVMPPSSCQLQFVSAQDGTCTELLGAAGSMSIVIYRTANGGASWHKVFTNSAQATEPVLKGPPGSIPFGCDKSVYFESPSKGFTLFFCNGGSGAIVYETLNGGLSWVVQHVTQPSSVPVGGGGFTGQPVFVGAKGAIPYTVGNHSAVYVTDNGGQSFDPVYPPGKPKQWTEDIVSPSLWRLTHGKEILATNNAGTSWFRKTSSTVLQTTDHVKGAPPGGLVQFTTRNDGWLTYDPYGPKPLLLRTTDGGRQWRTVVVPGTEKL